MGDGVLEVNKGSDRVIAGSEKGVMAQRRNCSSNSSPGSAVHHAGDDRSRTDRTPVMAVWCGDAAPMPKKTGRFAVPYSILCLVFQLGRSLCRLTGHRAMNDIVDVHG